MSTLTNQPAKFWKETALELGTATKDSLNYLLKTDEDFEDLIGEYDPVVNKSLREFKKALKTHDKLSEWNNLLKDHQDKRKALKRAEKQQAEAEARRAEEEERDNMRQEMIKVIRQKTEPEPEPEPMYGPLTDHLKIHQDCPDFSMLMGKIAMASRSGENREYMGPVLLALLNTLPDHTSM